MNRLDGRSMGWMSGCYHDGNEQEGYQLPLRSVRREVPEVPPALVVTALATYAVRGACCTSLVQDQPAERAVNNGFDQIEEEGSIFIC